MIMAARNMKRIKPKQMPAISPELNPVLPFSVVLKLNQSVDENLFSSMKPLKKAWYCVFSSNG